MADESAGISPEGTADDGALYGPGTALLVVDVQNDFADPAGTLFVAGGPDVVEAVNHEVSRAVAAGSAVVLTRDWHPPETPHFAAQGGVWPVHCVRGTWGAEPPVALRAEGPVVHKGTNGEDGYSGFTMRDPVTGDEVPTELARTLRTAGATAVVVVGLATDYCVRATALDAVRLGFGTTVLRSAVAAVDLRPGDGEAALAEMVANGARVV
ncbi:MAG TPA: isochorismatase family protein [Acidimicrobiales bacterium]